MGELQCIDKLINGSKQLYDMLVEQYLTPLRFDMEAEHCDNRLLLGPDSKLYTAAYCLFSWNANQHGRVVWFFLDSQIPHMSSIVACIGFPKPTTGLPIFVMNLNLKLHLSTYSTVIGYRGPAYTLDSPVLAIPELDSTKPLPLLSNPPPQGFAGIRSMFALSETVISWSLEVAEKSLTNWLASLNSCAETMADPSAMFDYISQYKDEMITLHNQKEQVFDLVFGENWVIDLFRVHVFH